MSKHNPQEQSTGNSRAVAHVWVRLRTISDMISKPLLNLPLPLVVGAIVIFAVTKNGFGVYPAIDISLYIAQGLPSLPTLPPMAEYHLSSLAGPVLARALGVLDLQGYVTLHGAALLTVFVALIWTIRVRRGDLAARMSTLALCASAVPVVLLQWIGSYDVFTFALGTFLVVVQSWPVLLMLSIGLGLFHFEQGVVILALLVLLNANPRWNRLAFGLIGAVGLLSGKLALALYLQANGMHVFDARLRYMLSGPSPGGGYLEMAIGGLPSLLYSLLGGAWLWLPVVLFVVGSRWEEMRLVPAALGLAVLPALLTHDQTRVYAMITAPVLLFVALVIAERGTPDEIALSVTTALSSLVVAPAVLVWEGVAAVPRFLGGLRDN